MSDGTTRGRRDRSARLPAALIILTILGVAGVAVWLTLAPPASERVPVARVTLGLPGAAGSSVSLSVPGVAPAAVDRGNAPAAGPPENAAPQLAPNNPTAVPAAPPPTAAAPAQEGRPPPAAGAPPPEIAPDIPPLPKAETGPALPKAPDPALVELSDNGPLPIIGRDGREPWRVYARPFDETDKRPRIAIVLYGLGMSAAATSAAIERLPGAISLAFAPYADDLTDWIAEARAAGHETLMMVPMEPSDFPVSDPGPRALMTSLSAAQNVSRLEWILSRATGYVGVTDYMGTRFTASGGHMLAVLSVLRQRGLMYLASRPGAADLARKLAAQLQLPFTRNALYIDSHASRDSIDAQLAEIERLATETGRAVGMGFTYPVTIERLAHWARSVQDRGFVLAPVSALVTRGDGL